MASTFQIKQASPDQLRIELFGFVDAVRIAELEKELTATVRKLPAKSFTVVVSTVGVIECAMDAREGLVRVQQLLAPAATRTAYVDDRPAFRGLALWVVHLAADGNAKAVSSMEHARAWLSSTVQRVDGARAQAVGA